MGLSSTQCEKIKSSFKSGSLKVQSVNPDGIPEWRQVQALHRAEVPWDPLVEITTKSGSMILTGGHRVFTEPTRKMESENLCPGDLTLGVIEGEVAAVAVMSTRSLPPRKFMFDMTVEGWHNFLVHNTKVIVSNSPDRVYHFRPPEGEGKVGCYNQVFGFIWTEEEFADFLEMALWKWNTAPPNTNPTYPTVDSICSKRPEWQTALLWGALVNAAMMLAFRWTADEFSYSIGGISLDIEKSSKYMDLKRNAEEQWDKLKEDKVRTEKYVRGLSQPRFGRGVRSAFGGAVGKGILSPRSFI